MFRELTCIFVFDPRYVSVGAVVIELNPRPSLPLVLKMMTRKLPQHILSSVRITHA